MGNRISILRTKFVNLCDQDSSIGYRMFDDYDQTYCNIFGPGLDLPEGLDLLKWILKNGDEKSQAMLDFVRESEAGIYIDSDWYAWDEIKSAFSFDDFEEVEDEMS